MEPAADSAGAAGAAAWGFLMFFHVRCWLEALLLVDGGGSPHDPKQGVVWNPPLTGQPQQVRLVGPLFSVLPCSLCNSVFGAAAKLLAGVARLCLRF